MFELTIPEILGGAVKNARMLHSNDNPEVI
jgi:hypothetical protein